MIVQDVLIRMNWINVHFRSLWQSVYLLLNSPCLSLIVNGFEKKKKNIYNYLALSNWHCIQDYAVQFVQA